jgi:nicotinamide-nucleotide amidase
MKGMMEEVIPLLSLRFQTGFIAHRTLLTAGAGESFLADMIQEFEEGPAPAFKACLPAQLWHGKASVEHNRF